MTAPPPPATASAQERFAAALAQHQGIVLKVARSYCRDPEDRRDLIQDIGTQAWRAFPGFDPERAQFSTWLYRIALNVAISQQRSLGLRARHRGALADTAEPVAAATAEDDVRVRELHALIRRLPPLDRALMLLYLDDCSHREIGEVLGLSAGSVATRLYRLRQQIRQQFNPSPSA
ncbi:sigma-70 family RNA polymerase sigma factor [Stenotrophomonas sp. YIM B06876]|uniref:RNA polymerase sigma factor n=1 Tax=Stenotrophomonas sp. YIM B06876 TaxID=3060211 RepID=UPI002738EF42|nr:sigma-70 family RNA polymerase sigma factor [Stenotrophomonas sp. YIM B06876]